jgi:diguanylate cyclase (GGDEF)-like protein
MTDGSMQQAQSGQGTAEKQLAERLARAREAQKESRLDEGLALAEAAWDQACALGLVAEQIEAGRLRTFFLYRRGALAPMLVAAEAVLPLLRAQGADPGLFDLLRWMTFGACEIGDFETAMRCGTEAHALAHELRDTSLIALALNALGACFERMGDPWQAERLMNEAAALVRVQATPYERVVTLNNLCGVCLGAFYLLRDSGNDAECTAALDRALGYAREARPHALEYGDPFALAMTEGNLGEALLHSGALDEAEQLLAQALTQAGARGFVAQCWRLRCSVAELMLLRDEPRRAWDDLDQLLREMADKGPAATALRAHHALYRAAKQLGQAADALAQFEAYQTIERRRSIAQLRAQSRLFVTRLESEQARAQADNARREASVQRARAQTLEEDAQRDPLTGLGNRRLMEARILPLMRDAERDGLPLTLAMIDADRFKAVNDRFGHEVGDRVLAQLAAMLKENTRASDLLVRYGGEEFLVVFPDTLSDRAFEVCDRLRQRVDTYRWSEIAEGLAVTLSIGLASAPPYAADLLIARADAAMYQAKHLGRNRVALA